MDFCTIGDDECIDSSIHVLLLSGWTLCCQFCKSEHFALDEIRKNLSWNDLLAGISLLKYGNNLRRLFLPVASPAVRWSSYALVPAARRLEQWRLGDNVIFWAECQFCQSRSVSQVTCWASAVTIQQMNSTGRADCSRDLLHVAFHSFVVADRCLFGWLMLLLFSPYFCCLVLSFPLSDSLCCSVVDMLDFVHCHQLNLVIAKKISCSEGLVCLCVLWGLKRRKVATFCTFYFASRMCEWLNVSVVQSLCHWHNHMMHSGTYLSISSPLWLLAALLTWVQTDEVKPAADCYFCWAQACIFQMALLNYDLITSFSKAITTDSCNASLVPLRITSWLHMHVQLLRLRALMYFLASGGLSLCSADLRIYSFKFISSSWFKELLGWKYFHQETKASYYVQFLWSMLESFTP